MPDFHESLDAAIERQPAICPDCKKELDSFACRIRHINIDTSWAKGDH